MPGNSASTELDVQSVDAVVSHETKIRTLQRLSIILLAAGLLLGIWNAWRVWTCARGSNVAAAPEPGDVEPPECPSPDPVDTAAPEPGPTREPSDDGVDHDGRRSDRGSR